ncbi:hepatoma-derived growth factor-related protein 2-like isoform X2 [Panicum virgatum]|uniref:hepatoma-derived growth factor-related protein 2-like isoform X2 n=1 Tax=Panicum virgatum TaxID=38727 RepID=UPI0019D577FA|nr:hepatoma-derived growth factor-related protein 2-like isoform X2 [Panicum virgatum]
MCFCGSLCKLMKSRVLGDDFGMRFFMCENYEYDPPNHYGKDRAKWLDTEQSQQDKDHVERQAKWAAQRRQRMLHEEQMDEKRKKDQEEIQKRIAEVECQKAEERETDRERKLERARRAKEAGPEAIRKGKYPRCTQ